MRPFLVRGTSGANACALTRSARSSPSLHANFRRDLYGYLLSVEVIILLKDWVHIKNTLRFL